MKFLFNTASVTVVGNFKHFLLALTISSQVCSIMSRNGQKLMEPNLTEKDSIGKSMKRNRMIPYSGTFPRGKTFAYFVVQKGTRNFYPRIVCACAGIMCRSRQSRIFYPQICLIAAIHEIFVPRKFPAIRY